MNDAETIFRDIDRTAIGKASRRTRY